MDTQKKASDYVKRISFKHLFLMIFVILLIESDSFNQIFIGNDVSYWWGRFIKISAFAFGYITSDIVINSGCI